LKRKKQRSTSMLNGLHGLLRTKLDLASDI
jgi:hypothetical protein